MKRMKTLRKMTYGAALGLGLALIGAKAAAAEIPLVTTSTNENFDTMGTTATASLPAGWVFSPAGTAAPTYAAVGNLTAVTQQATNGTPTTGARYNWGNGANAADRAPGFMTSSGYASPNSIMVGYVNNNATALTAVTLAFDYERYRINTAAAQVNFFYSTDGSTWIAVTGGDSGAFATGANTYTFTGGTVVSKTGISITGLNVAPGSKIYFRWNFNTTGSNSQGLGLDNVSVVGTFASGGVPPTVTGISPGSISANAGDTASITVTANGDAPTYLWYKETANSTNLIPSATTATLTLTNVLAADAANYQVILTNAFGRDTSSVVTVTVVDPYITAQPIGQIALLGGRVSFAVAANGTSLGYQWYVKPTSDSDFTGASSVVDGGAGRISGSTTALLTLTNLSALDATNYYVVVTNTLGSGVTSSVVTLGVANTASLAYWDFNGFLNFTNPSVAAGAGTATYTNCAPFSNSIASAIDPGSVTPNNGWGSSTYPTNGNPANNKTSGLRFNVSTAGAKNVTVSYDTRATSTASKYERLQYTTNGIDFIDYPTSSTFVQAVNYESRAFDLTGFPGVANNPAFAVRMVAEFESTAKYGATNNAQYVGNGGSYATSGTVSYDIVNIKGDAITNGNAAPVITTTSFTNVVTTDLASPTVLGFTVSDDTTAAGSLSVTAVSLNESVISSGNVAVGGSGASRTVSITPTLNALGASPILVTVTDGNGDSTKAWFYVTVNPGNQPPTITGLVTTNMLGNSTGTFAFTVGDDLTAVGSLTVSVLSGNSTLVPNDVSHVTTGGSGASRTLIITPATGQYGTAPIAVTVNDGTKSTTANLVLVVRPNKVTEMYEGFGYDTGGAIVNVTGGFWATHSGTPAQMQVGSGVVTITDGNSEDVNAPLIDGPFTNGTLYSSFTLNVSALPTDTGTYFAHFKDATTGGFFGRVYITTHNAASGSYRIGIGTSSGVTNDTAQIAQDLTPGVNYTVVTRLVLTNGASTIWLNPSTEASASMTDPATSSPTPITTYALRESTGEGTLTVDNLKVARNFLSVISDVVDVAPVANPDGYSILGNTTNNVLSVLTNDVLNMVQGSLSIASVSATNGTATISASGTNILFTPTTSFAGTATIGYTITDGFGGTSTSLATVTVVSPAPTPEPIIFQTLPGKFVMSWSQANFNLARSTNVAGPYVIIPGATSPFTNNMTTNAASFFRLVY